MLRLALICGCITLLGGWWLRRRQQQKEQQKNVPLCDRADFNLLLRDEINMEQYRSDVLAWANEQMSVPTLPRILHALVHLDTAPYPDIEPDLLGFQNWGLMFCLYHFEDTRYMTISNLYNEYIEWCVNKKLANLVLDEGPDHGILSD